MLNLDKNGTYLVAVSNGPDSKALMNMMYESNYHFYVGHVNYHHRKEAEVEEKELQEYCLKRNIKFIKKDAYYQKGNFEDWARKIRYTFFAEIVKEFSLNGVVVAHHKDDLLETYFLQKERGYITYYGIKEVSLIKGIKVYRPLLDFTKDDLISYCKNHNLFYSLDITNNDISLRRNYYRLTKINKMTLLEKDNLIKQINLENKALALIDQKISKIKNYDDYLLLSQEEKDRYLFKLINDYDSSINLSKRRLLDIETKLNKPGNVLIELNKNLILLKEYTSLNVVKKESYTYSIEITKPDIYENDFVYFNLINNEAFFYIKENSYPLKLEVVSLKDKVKIGNIEKSINRLFIDEKIKISKRWYWPKLVDKNGKIIFVPRNENDNLNRYHIK